VEYDKQKLATLYCSKGKIGGAKGLRTLNNMLICMSSERIAPCVGNLDSIRGGLVNLLYYSHEVPEGSKAQVEEVDVMYFIYREMYHVILDK
jgi:hypothetical protein